MSIFSKTKTVRLEKKVSIKERIIYWFYLYRYHFLGIGIIIAFILVFSFLFFFTPPVESGQYYNHFQG